MLLAWKQSSISSGGQHVLDRGIYRALLLVLKGLVSQGEPAERHSCHAFAKTWPKQGGRGGTAPAELCQVCNPGLATEQP